MKQSSENWAENFKPNEGGVDRIEVISDFLNTIMATIPDELEERVKSLRNLGNNLQNTLKSAQADLGRVSADLKRFQSELEYLVLLINGLADTATKASIIRPILQALDTEDKEDEPEREV